MRAEGGREGVVGGGGRDGGKIGIYQVTAWRPGRRRGFGVRLKRNDVKTWLNILSPRRGAGRGAWRDPRAPAGGPGLSFKQVQ